MCGKLYRTPIMLLRVKKTHCIEFCFELSKELCREELFLTIQASKHGVDVRLQVQCYLNYPNSPRYVTLTGYKGPVEFAKLHSVRALIPLVCSGSPIATSTYLREIGKKEEFEKTPSVLALQPNNHPVHLHLEVRFSGNCDCLMEGRDAEFVCWFKDEKFSDVTVHLSDGSTFPVSFWGFCRVAMVYKDLNSGPSIAAGEKIPLFSYIFR